MSDEPDFATDLGPLLDRHWPAALRDAPAPAGHRSSARALWRALDARGWLSPWWPPAHGGRTWRAERQLAFQRACAAAGVPWPRGQRLGPALWRFGSQEQLSRHLEPARNGSVTWDYALGEDLSATPVKGGFELSGTTAVDPEADWLAVLAPCETRQLLLLVERPGRGGKQVVRFEHHFVPASERVGDDGLEVARSIAPAALPLAASVALRRKLDRLVELAAGRNDGNGGRLLDSGTVQRRIDTLGVAIVGLEAMEMRMALGGDDDLGVALAVRAARLGRRLSDLIVDLLGYHALPNPTGPEHHNEPPIEQARPEWVRAAMASLVDDGLPEWAWVDALWKALERPGAPREHR